MNIVSHHLENCFYPLVHQNTWGVVSLISEKQAEDVSIQESEILLLVPSRSQTFLSHRYGFQVVFRFDWSLVNSNGDNLQWSISSLNSLLIEGCPFLTTGRPCSPIQIDENGGVYILGRTELRRLPESIEYSVRSASISGRYLDHDYYGCTNYSCQGSVEADRMLRRRATKGGVISKVETLYYSNQRTVNGNTKSWLSKRSVRSFLVLVSEKGQVNSCGIQWRPIFESREDLSSSSLNGPPCFCHSCRSVIMFTMW